MPERNWLDPEVTPVMTVEEAGEVLGLSRSASYDAAARGDIPTIRIGRRLLVPTAGLRRLLRLDPQTAPPAQRPTARTPRAQPPSLQEGASSMCTECVYWEAESLLGRLVSGHLRILRRTDRRPIDEGDHRGWIVPPDDDWSYIGVIQALRPDTCTYELVEVGLSVLEHRRFVDGALVAMGPDLTKNGEEGHSDG